MTTPPDLPTFLDARITEDEERARDFEHSHALCMNGDYGLGGQERAPGYWAAVKQIGFTPARVLAECQAKREIVRLWSETEEGTYGDQGPSIAAEAAYAVAAVYSTHPDYRSEWAP